MATPFINLIIGQIIIINRIDEPYNVGELLFHLVLKDLIDRLISEKHLKVFALFPILTELFYDPMPLITLAYHDIFGILKQSSDCQAHYMTLNIRCWHAADKGNPIYFSRCMHLLEPFIRRHRSFYCCIKTFTDVRKYTRVRGRGRYSGRGRGRVNHPRWYSVLG